MGAKGDEFGDRMKSYESFETGRRFMPYLPIYARIDGRGFSKFTRGMDRPYDIRMQRAMIETTRLLVEHTHARIGYTQSDEISLVWLQERDNGGVFFDSKIQKMVSVLAALATAAFTRAVTQEGGDFTAYADRMPHFDARVFSLPNKDEAANAILWREKDATKNAVSMAARHYYSHRELHGKSSAEMQEMLHAAGVNFNNYPPAFKRGTFLLRVVEERPLSNEELARIPEQHRYDKIGKTFTRSTVKAVDMPPFGRVTNRVDVIFESKDPLTASDLEAV